MARNNSLFLEIVAPSGIVFGGDVDSFSVPSYNGTLTILPHHAPLFTKLTEGEVRVNSENKDTILVISGGFLEIKNNSAHILSDYAIRAESIEMAKSEERKRQAEQKLKEKLDVRDFTIVDKDLKMSILELKVAEKVRRRHRA